MKVDTKLSPQGYLYENDGALHPFWEKDGGGGTGTIPDITATATVDGTTGTPAVEVTQTGDHGENIDFAFSGLKGEKGDKGDVGPAGPEGPQGPKGEDGTSVIPANIVKNVTMDATPNVTMGTTDYDLAYRTNDDQKHNAQTVHLATKQLVLENARTTAGTNGTDKIGEITLYTLDQTGNEGSQSFGIVAITQSDGSISLCPALNKDGTWEYGQEFLKIPSIPQTYVKEAYIGNPTIEDNMQYYSLRKIMVRDGVEQAESHENFGTFDPEYMVEHVLVDGGWTAPSGKYTTNKATFKTRWNHGGVVTEQTENFTVNAPIADKNYTDVTMTSATTDSGTTYSLKKTDMDGKVADIGTIEIPKAGGGTGTIPDITATATVDGTTGTPSVEVTQTGDHGENIGFAFSGLKGEKGDKGDVGPQGPQGPKGDPGSGGGSIETWQYYFMGYRTSIFGNALSDRITACIQVPVFKQLYLTYSPNILFNIYNASGEAIAVNVNCSIDTPVNGVIGITYLGQFTAPVNSIVRIIPTTDMIISASTNRAKADAAYKEFKAQYYALHNRLDVVADKKKEEV